MYTNPIKPKVLKIASPATNPYISNNILYIGLISLKDEFSTNEKYVNTESKILSMINIITCLSIDFL